VISFRIVALTLPAAAAFLAPALWAWRPRWKAVTIGHAALLLILVLWGLAGGASAAALLAVAAMSTAFAMFALGLHLAAGQAVSGLMVVALSGTLFIAPQIVRTAVDRNKSSLAQSRLDELLAVNPWAVLAAGPFQLDLLRDFPSMYRSSHMADYVDARPPAWPGVAAGYAFGGLVLGAAALGGRRLSRRSPASPP
jgi:hypothetical protein